jgi:hypothetical protein
LITLDKTTKGGKMKIVYNKKASESFSWDKEVAACSSITKAIKEGDSKVGSLGCKVIDDPKLAKYEVTFNSYTADTRTVMLVVDAVDADGKSIVSDPSKTVVRTQEQSPPLAGKF